VLDAPLPADDTTRELRGLVAAGQFREALESFRRAGQPAARAEAALLAAGAAFRLGELSTARELARQADQQFNSRADADGRMRSANLLGVIAFEQGNLTEAEAAFGRSLALAHSLDDGLMAAHSSNNLASVAHLRGNADLALSLYRGALLEYQRLGDRRGTAQTYYNLGLTFRELAIRLDADSASAEAVRHAEMVGERSLMALAVIGRAEYHLDAGEPEVATREMERAEALAKVAGDEIGEADAQRVRARIALVDGEAAHALDAAESARATAARCGNLQLQGECAALAAQALDLLGRAPEAASRKAEAAGIFRRLGATRLLERLEAN
jgi:tetratricopeptide (TPR) repeat protein